MSRNIEFFGGMGSSLFDLAMIAEKAGNCVWLATNSPKHSNAMSAAAMPTASLSFGPRLSGWRMQRLSTTPLGRVRPRQPPKSALSRPPLAALGRDGLIPETYSDLSRRIDPR